MLSSGTRERSIAIWNLHGGKTQRSSCVLSIECPAIFVDCKCSDEGEIHILVISSVICYFWSRNNVNDMHNKKPTKIFDRSKLINLSEFSLFLKAKL
jgi:U3 small nucleolar RNA-associated protein 5